MAVPVDLDDTKQMTDIVRSTIGTKFSSRFGDQMVDLALTAVQKVVKDGADGKKEVSARRLRNVACADPAAPASHLPPLLAPTSTTAPRSHQHGSA